MLPPEIGLMVELPGAEPEDLESTFFPCLAIYTMKKPESKTT
jgi:hypothetical protein